MSWKDPAATNTYAVPLVLAVQVTVYVAPEPEKFPREHPDAVMSDCVKSVVVSLDVKVSAIAAVVMPPPLETVSEIIVMVGLAVS